MLDVISSLYIVIVGFIVTSMQYKLDYVDVINKCFEGGYDDQIIRDKVIIGQNPTESAISCEIDFVLQIR